MIQLTLDTKNCMAALLLGNVFDSLHLIEGEITTFNAFHIDGQIRKHFYDEEDSAFLESLPEYSLWRDMREFCFSIIKGKRTPLEFKFILRLGTADIFRLLAEHGLSLQEQDISGLYLNFRFHNQTLTCTSGTSLSLFSLDKTLEQAWDQYVKDMLGKWIMET